MNIKLFVGLLLLTIGCQAQESKDSIRATLEANTNKSGWFVMHITNTSSHPLRFLDIREGSGWCGEFYEVTVEKDGEMYESKGNCFYAPVDVPEVVELAPGKTYDREIQPVAYVFSEKYLVPPCKITVTYRLTERIKEHLKINTVKADLNLTFQTQQIKIETSNN